MELRIERLVAGGRGLAREPEGRVVLVEGALPGETVEVEITRSRPRMAEARVTRVISASPGRVEPPCRHYDEGCGGCDLLHADPATQVEAKVGIVTDALVRLGKVRDVPVDPGEVLPTTGFRTTLRVGVAEGRPGLRRRRSHELLAVDDCLVAHPLVRGLLGEDRFDSMSEATVRVGARTGDTMVVALDGPDEDARTPPERGGVGADSAPGSIHEIIGRRRMQISARSFFQSRPDGAEALIRAVGRALSPYDPNTDRLVDLYGGVGLFTLGLGARRAVLVEVSSSACADARVNTAELGTEVIECDVTRWHPVQADAVVADPPRQGLGADGVAVVAATGAPHVALVSCDAAALGRDVGLFADHGYRAERVELVDMFPGTHHIEAVTTLRLGDPE